MLSKKKKCGREDKKQRERIFEAQKKQAKVLDKWCIRVKENSDATEESTSENIRSENNESIRTPQHPESNELGEEFAASKSNDLRFEKPTDWEENKKIDINDPSCWDLSSDKFRTSLIFHGSEHKDMEIYPGTSDDRNFNKYWIYNKLSNGGKQYRKWLF